MKGIDIFCASQAATAICLSMEEGSSSTPSSSSSTILLGSGRAIDRYNPIIRDSRRIAKSLPPCTTSHPPISPKPQKVHHKKKNKRIPFKENEDQPKKSDSSSLTKLVDEKIKNSNGATTNDGNGSTDTAVVRKSWSCTKPGDFISPAGSTRYLLRDKVFFNALSDSDPAAKLSPEETSKSKDVKTEEEPCDAKPPSSSHSPDQVVVLKVSLHCRGCERKLRKHLSRMEGVTSFNIDFAAKKVTVTGNVTPLGVLSSISKVKNAQLWSPTISSSIPPSVNLSTSEFKNDYKGAGA
ncbi:hypothetical protein Pfo_004318 [Paulownia fortunei]|nr:hypothetical protein Pfo_004318 [Paulownia fortunei]